MNHYKSFRRQLNFYSILQSKDIQHCPDNGTFFYGRAYSRRSTHSFELIRLTLYAFLFSSFPVAYSHRLFVRGHRYLCEYMERTKQNQGMAQAAKSSAPRIATLRTSKEGSQNPNAEDTFTTTVPFHKDIEDLQSSHDISQSPILNARLAPNITQASQIYHSFMSQEWNGLPKGVTPKDIIGDIVATFGRAWMVCGDRPLFHFLAAI